MYFSPKTLVLLVLPGTTVELEESGPSAETEVEPRVSRQRANSPATHNSYKSCTVVRKECEVVLSIHEPAGGDTRLPQC